jgi:hypothetical protein
MMDDTPVSTTVSSGTGREEAASTLESSAGERESGSTPDTGAAGLQPAQPERPAGRAGRALPRLQLAEPEPPRLLYEKGQLPSDDSPILYCERAYVVDGLQSDDELAEHLLAVLASIRESWRERDSPQFVQLAAFDHGFETEPQFPPLATLSWKDWQGRTEIWVRGVRRASPPSLIAGLDASDTEAAAGGTAPPAESKSGALETETPEAHGREALSHPPSETVELGTLRSDERTPLVSPVPPEHSRPPRSGDSGTSWQSPARSGEYRIASSEEEPSTPPPSSQRVLAGEELMGALFERMNELAYLPDLRAGAAYVLETLEEFIPCSGIAIHLLDGAACEFVLVLALGPRAAEQLGQRQPDLESLLGAAVREQRALRVEGSRSPVWDSLGLDIAHGLCAPVQQRGHVFGAIELGRSASEGEFSDSQLMALEFIGEQFAEFLSERPFQPQSF